ncbi:MAG: hypothetical protein ABL928_03090 [Sphingorhabdus sp.]
MRSFAIFTSFLIYAPLFFDSTRDIVIANKLAASIVTIVGAAFALYLGVRDQSDEERGAHGIGRIRVAIRYLLSQDKYASRVAAFMFACFAPIVYFLGGQ